MLRNEQFWSLMVVGALALALTGVNMWFYQANREMQGEANRRAQYIQQSIAMETLYRQIVKDLADRAVRTRDDQIRDMLAGEGLNLTFGTETGGGTSGAAAGDER